MKRTIFHIAIALFCLGALPLHAQSLIETLGALAIASDISGVSAKETSEAANEIQQPTQSVVPDVGQPSSLTAEPGADSEHVQALVTSTAQSGGENVPDVFSNRQVLRRWLGENPAFVYRSRNLPDPMVLPWVALEFKAGELQAQADMLWKEGSKENWRKAIELMEHLVAEYPTTNIAQKARLQLANRRAEYAQKFPDKSDLPKQTIVREPDPEFPNWVKNQFTSVVLGPSVNKIMINSVIYEPGDVIHGTESSPVKIVEINNLPDNSRLCYAVFEFDDKIYRFQPKGLTVPGFANPK